MILCSEFDHNTDSKIKATSYNYDEKNRGFVHQRT